MTLRVTTEAELQERFRACAAAHGLRLHRIHMQSAARNGSFAATVVFDCTCQQRWLLRVAQGELVAVDAGILTELRKGREGQTTSPPGHAGAQATPRRSGRRPPAS